MGQVAEGGQKTRGKRKHENETFKFLEKFRLGESCTVAEISEKDVRTAGTARSTQQVESSKAGLWSGLALRKQRTWMEAGMDTGLSVKWLSHQVWMRG